VTAPRLAAGQVVAGKYSIRAMLGYGGATATYSAVLAPGRDVVVKLFSPQLAQRGDVLGTLQQVAAVTNGLSDVTAPILESGFDPATGAPFMVIDLATIPSLAQAVQRGPFPSADVVLLLRGIARAVDAAHAQRTVHGALKPQNVFVGPAPARPVRVIDFGVAVARAALPTSEGYAIAAPWIAPEQMQGTPGGAPADVFSAALVAFFAATGRSYWRSCQGPTPDLAAWQQEISGPRVAPSVRARELGASLATSFDGPLVRALALNPAERFATVAELAETLAKAGGSVGPQKMAMTMPLNAMPQAAQDLLRQQIAGAATTAQDQGGGTTLAVSPTSDAQWPQGPSHSQRPPQQGRLAQTALMPQQPQQPYPTHVMSSPQGGAGMSPTPMVGFPPGGPPMMQGGAQPGYSIGPPPDSVVVVPKSKAGLFIVLALVALFLAAAAVGVVFMLQRRTAVATTDTKPEASESAAATTAPPTAAAATAVAPTTTATAPPVETQDSGSAAAQTATDAGALAMAGADGSAAAVAELTVVCVPDCDSVKIDNTTLDTSDAGVVPPDPVEVTAGPHTIAVGRASYAPQTKKVTLKAGQKAKEIFHLFKPGAVALPKPCGKFLERCPN
jgi:serine/threonine protein kinase